MRVRSPSQGVMINALAAASAALAAILIAPPPVAAQYARNLRQLVIAVFALAITVWLPAEVFLGASVLVLATSSAVSAVSLGPLQLYTYDILLALVLLRASVPRSRRPSAFRIIDPVVGVPVALWAVVMLAAGVRGMAAGNAFGQIARLEIPLVYFPLFCWGFARILREERVTQPRVLRALAITSVGLVAYAGWARLTHHRFGNASGSGIGVVPTKNGELRRDYGFFSAFEVYPLLALAGVAYLLFSSRQRYSAMLIAGIGLGATFLTLVRALVFGLVVGTAWLITLLVRSRWELRLGSRLLPLIALFALAGVVFFAFSPAAARGVAERMLPGVATQSEVATQNAEVRGKVLKTAVRIAWDDPLGVGLQNSDTLERIGYDPARVPENQWAALLVFTGWPGVLFFLWAGVALIRRSSQLPAAAPWLHPLVVATALLVLVQGFGWNILFSQTWSLGLIALVFALRLASAPADPGVRDARLA